MGGVLKDQDSLITRKLLADRWQIVYKVAHTYEAIKYFIDYDKPFKNHKIESCYRFSTSETTIQKMKIEPLWNVS